MRRAAVIFFNAAWFFACGYVLYACYKVSSRNGSSQAVEYKPRQYGDFYPR